MKSEAMARRATIGIDKSTGIIHFNVPHGTSLADALRALGQIDVAKIPGRSGCPACMCGHGFHIREDFEKEIQVELPQVRQMERAE